MGNIEIDGISTQGFLLNNNSGYAAISSVTADNMEVSLGSVNITIKKSTTDETRIEIVTSGIMESPVTSQGSYSCYVSEEFVKSSINYDTAKFQSYVCFQDTDTLRIHRKRNQSGL